MKETTAEAIKHEELVKRAVQWLRGQKCPLVLAGMASCNEIPDAIGFATSRTIVVECKTSKSDFHRDRVKYSRYVDERGHHYPCKGFKGRGQDLSAYKLVRIPNMGTERWYLSEPDVIDEEMVRKHHPDHGLLHIQGRVIRKVIPAPQRPADRRDSPSEVRYIQYAMRHVLGNLAGNGVTVDLLQAAKMFGHHGIKFRPNTAAARAQEFQ